jgi:hypothetical protein
MLMWPTAQDGLAFDRCIENRNLLLDAKILALRIPAVLRSRGAQ